MENQQPPKTIEEVGIHLFYMSEKLETMSRQLKALAENQVSIDNFLALKGEVKDLQEVVEQIKTWKETMTGRMWGIMAVITMSAGVLSFVINNVLNYLISKGKI
jgi:hypothetical protein